MIILLYKFFILKKKKKKKKQSENVYFKSKHFGRNSPFINKNLMKKIVPLKRKYL